MERSAAAFRDESHCVEANGDVAFLTEDSLDEKRAIAHVADHGAGATVLFSGTTRNSFQGREVTKLEYESYTRLALNTMREILLKAHTSAPFFGMPPALSSNADPAMASNQDRITRCFIAHRLGEVPVGESSILIAVSSPHRREAFLAAEWILEEVKKNVAIWKREYYADGETVEALDGQTAPVTAGHAQQWSWKANFPPTRPEQP